MSDLVLDGKVALVTGAQRGIGEATARELHSRGACVVLTDLDGDATAAAARGIGERAIGIAGDVTDAEAMRAAVQTATDSFGGLDVCVANAGISAAMGTVAATRPAAWERVIEVNMLGVYRTVQAALPQLIERRGHASLVGSVYSFFNGMFVGPYAAAKAAVESLSRTLRVELAPYGASAGVAYYGFIATELVRDSFDTDPLAARLEAHAIPGFLRRRLTPDQAARALVDGIELRAPRVFAPRWLRGYSAVRGLVNPLLDRRLERDPAVQAMVLEADVPGRTAGRELVAARPEDQPRTRRRADAVDEREAIAGLERTEAALRDWADANGLVVSVDPMWPGAPGPHEQVGPVRHAVWSLAGRLPGGAAGRLRHQAVFGQTLGVNVAGQHTIMVCRLPESVGYIPLLCVRPDEFGSGLYYWGGDGRPRSEHEFESAELGRRFKVEIAKGQDQNWLYQLFAPTMIDWLAHETPQDFGFKLADGVFTCECPQWRGQARADGEVDPAYLDLIAQSGGRAAGRIRDEVLEEVGLLSDPDAPSSAAHAAFSARRHGRIVGALLKLASAGMDDGIGDYASPRGLEEVDPATFHARHITLPFPGTATNAVKGTLPGGREGYLAWLEFSSDVDMQKEYVAMVCETATELPTAWVDSEEIGVSGFGDEIAPAALEAARAAGYGIATAGRAANVYLRVSGTTPGEEVDRFAERAGEIADLLA